MCVASFLLVSLPARLFWSAVSGKMHVEPFQGRCVLSCLMPLFDSCCFFVAAAAATAAAAPAASAAGAG
jgi:hypothetical protein